MSTRNFPNPAFVTNQAQAQAERVIRTSYTRIVWEDSEDPDGYEEEHGWIDEEGEVFEPDETDIKNGLTPSESIVDQAVEFLRDSGAVEPSSSFFHQGIWYSTEYETTDRRTGEQEQRDFHLDGFTPEEEAAIYREVARRR